MADRTLSTYTEPAIHGQTYVLTVERSAAGKPGLFFSIQGHDDRGAFVDTCVIVENGNEFLAPVIAWLNA